MRQRTQQGAIARWVIRQRVFLFYGNGGQFVGDSVERWYQAIHHAKDLRLYVGGAGPIFSFDPDVRARGVELFKTRKLPFAVITDNAMHRVLGTTGRLLGMDLQIYSWNDSERPFLKLGLSQATTDELNSSLHKLRSEIDDELAQLATG
jgi:hypothetical protein